MRERVGDGPDPAPERAHATPARDVPAAEREERVLHLRAVALAMLLRPRAQERAVDTARAALAFPGPASGIPRAIAFRRHAFPGAPPTRFARATRTNVAMRSTSACSARRPSRVIA